MAHQGCESCRKWQEHCYQEHMDASRMRFFKLMTADFAQGISIPAKFGNNLRGQITQGLNLKAPSSETWRVGVTKKASELFLASGWDDFVRAHELEENDLLIFTRSGSCSFEVKIFDASGCEKVPCFFSSRKDPRMHTHTDGFRGQQAEHCISSDSDDLAMPLQLTGSPHKASTSNKMSVKTKPRKEPGSPNSSNYHIEHEDSNYYYYSRSAGSLTGEERDQIFSLVAIRPGNPAFVAVLQKTHVGLKNNLLTIHHGFAADHLEGRSHEILLLRPNKKHKWYVKYYHASNTRGFNCRRWIKFVQDNRLREDYICVFELMKGARKTTMVVHVLRKVNGGFLLLG